MNKGDILKRLSIEPILIAINFCIMVHRKGLNLKSGWTAYFIVSMLSHIR